MASDSNNKRFRQTLSEDGDCKELSGKTCNNRDGECSRERLFHGNSRRNPREDTTLLSNQDQPAAQSTQPSASFSAYNCNSTYNMIAPMNPTWSFNPVEGMASNMTINASQAAIPMNTGLDMVQPSVSNVNPYGYMVPSENTYSVGISSYCQYGMMSTPFRPVKEIIHLTKSVLYPPGPNALPPTTRSKPPGCKTVFVGGLPEKITEEIIKEIFEQVGTVEIVRMSKKNFCHVRFSSDIFVDNAVSMLSGYKLKIENKDEPAFYGRLHVDYARARDDEYEYECKQRCLQRQMRHQEELLRPETPPVVRYTDHEASLICEKLKSDETFLQAANVLELWLERGECSKKNAGSFYSMIQSTQSRVRKLQVDKAKHEEQLNKAKKMLQKQLEETIRKCRDIGKIYKAASLQKCSDHFTKPQRKNIEIWKKRTEELRNTHLEEVINEREDDEMELSDDENEESKTTVDVDQMKNQLKEEWRKLQEQCDSSRQLEASQKEVMVLQADHEKDIKQKDDELEKMREELHKSKKDVLNLTNKHCKDEVELKVLRALKIKRDEEVDEDDSARDSSDVGSGASASSSSAFVEREAHLISLLSVFLNVHPFGASIAYICSYLHQIDSSIQVRDVENLMRRFPRIFRESSIGIGASLGKMWYYDGFKK